MCPEKRQEEKFTARPLISELSPVIIDDEDDEGEEMLLNDGAVPVRWNTAALEYEYEVNEDTERGENMLLPEFCMPFS